MFGKKEVSVEVGDCFVEPLAGKKQIFRALGIAEKASAEAFVSTWESPKLPSSIISPMPASLTAKAALRAPFRWTRWRVRKII